MAFKLVQVVALATASLPSIVSAAPMTFGRDPATVTPGECYGNQIRMIVARGSGEPPGVGTLGQLTSRIQQSAHYATVQAVDYPAVTAYDAPYLASVKQGVYDLQKKIKQTVAQCPNAKIALLGYSQGANVVADAISGSLEDGLGTMPLDPTLADNVQAVMLFGDPTHSSAQDFMKSSGFNNGMIPRITNFLMNPYTSKIASWCDAGDPVCDGGSDYAVHTGYMNKYKDAAAAWSLTKLWT